MRHSTPSVYVDNYMVNNPSLKLAAKVARILNSTIEEIFIFEDCDLD